MSTIEQVYAEAWAAFEAWTREYDPDGEMSTYEQAQAYGRWLDTRECLSQQIQQKEE